MKTYYVSFEEQGNTEVVVKVEAEDEDEAYEKATHALLNNRYDIFCDEECPEDLDYGQLIDEDGYELDLDEELEEDDDDEEDED